MTIKMLTIREFANRLGISETTVYRMKDAGQIKCIKAGRKKSFRIPEKEVMLIQRYGFPFNTEKD